MSNKGLIIPPTVTFQHENAALKVYIDHKCRKLYRKCSRDEDH